MEFLSVSNSVFRDTRVGSLTDEARALEGGGFYMKDVYKMQLTGNTFEALAARVRGGALMIKQEEATYFGLAIEHETSAQAHYIIESNSFISCTAQ